MDNILKSIKKKNNKKENLLITFLTPYSYKIARKHLKLFDQFDVINIVGISLVKLLIFLI